MKVMSIKDGQWIRRRDGAPMVGPKYGDTCTVLGTKYYDYGTYYHLAEYMETAYPAPMYNCKHFIPLSDIDETELIKERDRWFDEIGTTSN